MRLRERIYAYDLPEVEAGYHINPRFTDKETEAQRVEVTCPTCHGHETAKQSVSRFSRLPGQCMSFWLGWGVLLSMVGTRVQVRTVGESAGQREPEARRTPGHPGSPGPLGSPCPHPCISHCHRWSGFQLTYLPSTSQAPFTTCWMAPRWMPPCCQVTQLFSP